MFVPTQKMLSELSSNPNQKILALDLKRRATHSKRDLDYQATVAEGYSSKKSGDFWGGTFVRIHQGSAYSRLGPL